MSAPAPASLQDLIDETKTAFIAAKADGKLDVSEVVQIAVQLAKRLQAVRAASGAEKRAVVVLTLKKGLEAAGGVASLPGLAESSPEMKAILEKQLLDAAAAAVDVALAVASGKVDLRKQGVRSCVLGCLKTGAAAAAAVLAPKDAAVVAEALAAVTAVASVALPTAAAAPEESKTESSPESAETKDEPAARDAEPAQPAAPAAPPPAAEDSAPEKQ